MSEQTSGAHAAPRRSRLALTAPSRRAAVVALSAAAWLLSAAPAGAADILAPGWNKLDYPPPKAGSYELQTLMPAGSGRVLRSDGKPAQLSDFFGDKVVLLNFVYTTCDDVNGCPLSTFVMHSIRKALKDRPELAAKLRIVTLSFDPQRDTPEVMRAYGAEFGGEEQTAEWRFLTTASNADLGPILKAYGQYVIPERNEAGEETGKFAHILKVYLVDLDARVRNIYSVSFLHPDVLLADVETLLLDAGGKGGKRS